MERPAPPPEEMRVNGETVLDAPLAFLDELDRLPELPDAVHERMDPTEELLGELLDLTDPDDQASVYLSDPPSTPVTEPVSSGPAKPRKKGSRPRRMDATAIRRQQIEHLRSQVEELEGELSRLHQSVVPSTVITPWEEIAKRQRDAKKRVEAENVRLRAVYQGQLKVARGLMTMLHKGQDDMISEWGSINKSRITETFESTEAIFRTIRESLGARPNNTVDEWMHENSLAHVSDRFDDAQVRCGTSNDVYVETLVCRRVPFPLEATAEALWGCLCTDHLELDNGIYGSVERSDTHYLARSKVGVKLPRLDSVLESFAVGSRFNESNRVVVSAEFRSIASSAADGGNRECLIELSYIVVERDPSCPSSSTLFRSCKRSWPLLDEACHEEVNRPKFELLADMIIDICNGNCQALFLHIENSLLGSILATQ